MWNYFFAVVKQIQSLSSDITEKRVGLYASLIDHMILQHAVWNDHIRAEQFFAVTQFLNEIFPIVNAHLQVQHRRVFAGTTGASGVVLHLLKRLCEDNIEIFQRFDKTLHLYKICFWHIHENRIPTKSGDHERM